MNVLLITILDCLCSLLVNIPVLQDTYFIASYLFYHKIIKQKANYYTCFKGLHTVVECRGLAN